MSSENAQENQEKNIENDQYHNDQCEDQDQKLTDIHENSSKNENSNNDVNNTNHEGDKLNSSNENNEQKVPVNNWESNNPDTTEEISVFEKNIETQILGKDDENLFKKSTEEKIEEDDKTTISKQNENSNQQLNKNNTLVENKLEAKLLNLGTLDEFTIEDSNILTENFEELSNESSSKDKEKKSKKNSKQINVIKSPFIENNLSKSTITKSINNISNNNHYLSEDSSIENNHNHINLIQENQVNCEHNHNHDHDNCSENKKLFEGIEKNEGCKNEHTYKFKEIAQTMIFSEYPKLFKSNDDVFYLSIFTLMWILLIQFEFIYGLVFTNSYIISDSFFNIFKIFAFITCLIALIIRKSVVINNIDSIDNIYFFKSRIEQIAALCNSIMITIISLYMMLNSLHMITEEEEFDYDSVKNKADEVNIMHNFNFVFLTIKIIMNILILTSFSEFVIPQNFNIKFQLKKKYNEWRNLNDINYEDLVLCSSETRRHNSGYSNFHSYTNILLVDFLCSFSLVILLYIFDLTYEKAYLFACVINLISTFLLTAPIFNILFYVFLNGRSSLYDSFYKECREILSSYENSIDVLDEKWWMISQNELSYIVKIHLKKQTYKSNNTNTCKGEDIFETSNIKNDIYKAANKVGLVVKMKIDIE